MADPWDSDATAPWSNDAQAGAAPAPAAAAAPAPGNPLFALHGPDKAGEFLHTAIDSGMFGLQDTIGGKIASLYGGPNADQLRAQTQAGRQDIGPIASGLADLTGYALGPGKFGAGARIAEGIGGGIAARMAGGAVEGGGAALAGTAGHGDVDPNDLGKATMYGTLARWRDRSAACGAYCAAKQKHP